MKFSLGALAALFCLIAHTAFGMPHIPPSAFVAACRSDSRTEQSNCEAFLRGTAERLQIHFQKGKAACRDRPVGGNDIADFQKYASAHMIPDSGEAFALVLNFWTSNLANVPCDGVPGYWSTGYLMSLCWADDSGASPCKMYTTSLLAMASVEAGLGNTRYFCPKGDTTRSDDEVLANFRSWVAADPGRGWTGCNRLH